MEYFNLALNIEWTDGGSYEIHAQSETMGEAKGTVSFAVACAQAVSSPASFSVSRSELERAPPSIGP